MKINKTIWLTKKAETIGSVYNNLGYLEIYDHPQAILYYKSGIKEIDNEFNPHGYIKSGFVCDMSATENTVTLFFFRYKGKKELHDLISVHIHRDSIKMLSVNEADNLTVVKKEEKKHKIKALGRRGFALVGNIVGEATKGIISANTTNASGNEFILEYFDRSNIKQSLYLYSPKEYSDQAELFLNTYYKTDLPDEAKQSLSNIPDSSCYIATACYKDTYAKEVIFFREYRDKVLSKYFIGRLFISTYYILSPRIYKSVFNSKTMSRRLKQILDRVYSTLK
jgi:hypothetical protein